MADDEKDPKSVDLSYLKDLGDMVRARNLFFVPFFGVFLAFIVTQSKYIIEGNPIIQLLIFVRLCWALGTLPSYQIIYGP